MDKYSYGRRFSVFFTESPSETDFLLDNLESDFLVRLFEKFNFPFDRKVVKSHKDFKMARNKWA